MAKKRTTEFIIYDDAHLRIAKAPTKAQAESYVRKMVKALPMGYGIKFVILEQPISHY